MNRPTLIPGLPRVWRGPDELQLGSDPARALLLRLPDPRVAKVLDLLDGTRSERMVLLRAAEMGVSPDDCRALLDTLHAAGLAMPFATLLPLTLQAATRHRLISEAAALAFRNAETAARPKNVETAARLTHAETPARPTHGESTAPPKAERQTPAQILRRRGTARVMITGSGRLGAGIAVALAESGVGHVRPEVTGPVLRDELAGGPLRGTDVGRPRREAIVDALSRVAPGTPSGVRRGAATLVVQLDHDQPVSLLSAAYAARRQPHLAVTIREGAAVIGPLVPPGGAPCLNCLHLHRKDRDADWPGPVRSTAAEPCTVATLLAATAFAVAEVLAFIDGGEPQTVGASVEIADPGRLRRRTWTPHPACSCASSRTTSTNPDRTFAPAPDEGH